MALSLIPQTVNNASGTLTPNAFLYGTFEYNLAGDIHVNAPTNEAEGQIICMMLNNDNNQYVATWDAAWRHDALPSDGFGKWAGLFVCKNGECLCVGFCYHG